jgi:hypothetical protein
MLKSLRAALAKYGDGAVDGDDENTDETDDETSGDGGEEPASDLDELLQAFVGVLKGRGFLSLSSL